MRNLSPSKDPIEASASELLRVCDGDKAREHRQVRVVPYHCHDAEEMKPHLRPLLESEEFPKAGIPPGQPMPCNAQRSPGLLAQAVGVLPADSPQCIHSIGDGSH